MKNLLKQTLLILSCILITALGFTILNANSATTIGLDVSTGNLALSGNITSGTWQGTSIGTQYGGTGQDFNSSTGLLKLTDGAASMITDSSTNWNTAYGWGDWSGQGFITVSSTGTLTNKSGNISMWTNDTNYLTSYTETDPVFSVSSASGIAADDITNWDTAHTYSQTGHLPLAGGEMTNNITFSGSQTVDGVDVSAIPPTVLSSATQPINSKGNSFSTIQAAINDMDTAGWVYAPPGTYTEAVDINTKNNLMLFGAGWGMTKITYAGNDHALDIDNSDDVIIRDIRIDQTSTGNGVNAIRLDDAQRCKIQDVYIGDSDTIGIYFEDADSANCEIINCYITNTDGSGIEENGSASNFTVMGTSIINVGEFGVFIDSKNCIITNNYINGIAASATGISIQSGAYNAIVTNNRIIDDTAWTTSHEPICDSSNSTVENNNCCVDEELPVAYNSKGCIFDTVQLAVTLQNGNGEVHVLPGSHEKVTISANNMTIIGTGPGVTIGSNAGHALSITGNYVTIKDMSLRTTSTGSNYDCINATGTHLVVDNVTFKDSDRYGLYLNGAYARINKSHFISTSIDSNDMYIDTGGDNSAIMGNTFVTLSIVDKGDRTTKMSNISANAGFIDNDGTDQVTVGNANVTVDDAGATTPQTANNS